MNIKIWAFVTAAILIITLIITSAPLPDEARAEPFVTPTLLRVGLEGAFRERDYINVNNGAVEIGFESGGDFSPRATIFSLTGGFTVKPEYAYCADMGFAGDYFDAMAISAQYTRAVPALTLEGWRVYAVSDDAADGFATNARRVTVYDGDRRVVICDGSLFPQISAAGGLTSLNGSQYRGRVEFGRYDGKKLTAVNVVHMEEYLPSVTAAEMPASWAPEALKAQAVAARTYAANMTATAKHGQAYHLCDTTHCQVYKGASNEDDRAIAAVEATRGQMIYYGGKPIEAVFSASSGGHTESSENVWGATVPYLRGVPEPNEIGAKEWERTFTQAELTAIASAKGYNVGTVTAISITKLSSTGRVLELTIRGSSDVKTLTKEETRTFCSTTSAGSLYSRNYVIAGGVKTVTPTVVYAQSADGVSAFELPSLLPGVMPEPAGKVSAITAQGLTTIETETYTFSEPSNGSLQSDGVTFVGRGNGHGVGMSQCGARGLAELGRDYIQILTYYYTGVEVR